MKKRRLISVMLAGSITIASAAALTGCDFEYGERFKKCNNVYIVLENNQEKVVHIGDVTPLRCNDIMHAWGTGFAELNLDCGKDYITNEDCYIYKSMPTENEDYTKVCENCFSFDETLTN